MAQKRGPITPMMLMGHSWEGSAWGRQQRSDVQQIQSRVKYADEMRKHLHQRWECEYLAQLRVFHQEKSRPVSKGEIVFVGDDKTKRPLWKIGMVMEVFRGRDGRIRVVRVKISSSTFIHMVTSPDCSTGGQERGRYPRNRGASRHADKNKNNQKTTQTESLSKTEKNHSNSLQNYTNVNWATRAKGGV